MALLRRWHLCYHMACAEGGAVPRNSRRGRLPERRQGVIDNNEIEDDLIRDMTEVLTSFCTRMYGKRGAKNKAQKALQTLQETQESAEEKDNQYVVL